MTIEKFGTVTSSGTKAFFEDSRLKIDCCQFGLDLESHIKRTPRKTISLCFKKDSGLQLVLLLYKSGNTNMLLYEQTIKIGTFVPASKFSTDSLDHIWEKYAKPVWKNQSALN